MATLLEVAHSRLISTIHTECGVLLDKQIHLLQCFQEKPNVTARPRRNPKIHCLLPKTRCHDPNYTVESRQEPQLLFEEQLPLVSCISSTPSWRFATMKMKLINVPCSLYLKSDASFVESIVFSFWGNKEQVVQASSTCSRGQFEMNENSSQE